MAGAILAEDFSTEPYWWREAPRPDWPEKTLPQNCDVAVVGSGYTGLMAAMTLARAGRDVVVLEAETPGYGASSRNAGFVSRTLYAKFPQLAKTHGEAAAVEMMREAGNASDHLFALVEAEQIRCHLVPCGRLLAAVNPAHYESLAKQLTLLSRKIGTEGEMLPRAEQHREIGTDYYHGLMVMRGTGTLHPALYHQGMLERSAAAGAAILARTPVTGIAEDSDGVRLTTPRGTLLARDVVVATNGYTGPLTPWLRRRVVSFDAAVIVTEPLPDGLMDKLLPNRGAMSDSKVNMYSARATPDGTRLQFMSNRGLMVPDEKAKAVEMHGHMTELFPELATTRIAHCWTGKMGFSFDRTPHIGESGRIRYAAGYSGSGLPMGTWLGKKLALKILGDPDGRTAFDALTFPAKPLYWGRPWFLPAAVRYYNWKDARAVAEGRRAQ